MISTLGTSSLPSNLFASASSWRLFQRLLQGDIIAWSIVAGIITVILLCIITWKLMHRGEKKEETRDENDHTHLN